MPRTAHDYVGPYRLLTLIRSGKTCQVIEAMDDRVSRRVAIKMLLPEFRDDRQESTFLKHEYEVGRKLDHSRVIKIYDCVVDGGAVHLVMELFPAPNLKQVINMGVEEIAPIVPIFIEQAAEGLGYFHGHGWVHRDIKPDNFLMNENGDVKLIDFALARRKVSGLGRFFSRKSGKIQGTRSYMSPEQIRGEVLDQRSDVYSFGCMIHELLCGKLPFTGATTNELLKKHLNAQPPRLTALNKNVSDDFATLVQKLLAKKPEARFDSMEDFLGALRKIEIFKVRPRSASN